MDNYIKIFLICFAFFIVCIIGILSYGIYLYNKKGDTDKETNNNKKIAGYLIMLGAVPIGVLLVQLLFFIGPHFLGI